MTFGITKEKNWIFCTVYMVFCWFPIKLNLNFKCLQQILLSIDLNQAYFWYLFDLISFSFKLVEKNILKMERTLHKIDFCYWKKCQLSVVVNIVYCSVIEFEIIFEGNFCSKQIPSVTFYSLLLDQIRMEGRRICN